MTDASSTTFDPEARPSWQRYLPAGAAATVAVAAVIGLQAQTSSGSTDRMGGRGGPPGMTGQPGQVPPWGGAGAGPQGMAPGGRGQLPSGAGQSPSQAAPDVAPAGQSGMASARTGVS